jgi:hypothetical protein
VPRGVARDVARASERVKKFTFKQEHLAQRRGGAEATNKIKQLFTLNLCASASLRELIYFFTASLARERAWPGWPWHEAWHGRPTRDGHGRDGQGTFPPHYILPAPNCYKIAGHDLSSRCAVSLHITVKDVKKVKECRNANYLKTV